MEEKERYELNDNDCIIDNEKDVAICDVCDVSESPETLVDLLNQQDARIKELEEENKFLEKRNEELIIDRRDLCLERNDIFEENQQLKQSQKQLAIKELEKALVLVQNAVNLESPEYGLVGLYDAIVDQIKELKGEE